MNKILPCPCGQTEGERLNWIKPTKTKGYMVACTRCGRAGHLAATKAQAIDRWNAATDPYSSAPWPGFHDYPFRFEAMEE